MIEQEDQNSSVQVRKAIESIDPCGDGLRLEYFWQGDRFAHRILRLRSGVQGECLGETEESPNSEFWPVSPPVQQISLEEINSQPTVLGVGSTGTGHWSFCVQADVVDGMRGFVFDVALKPSKILERCGSRYRLKDNDALIVLPLEQIAGTLVAREEGAWCIKPRMESEATKKVTGGNRVIDTVRWAYFMGLKSSESD